MNRSIFRIWQFISGRFNFKLLFLNFIVITVIIFFSNFNRSVLACDPIKFFQLVHFNKGDLFTSPGTTITNLINARANLLDNWVLSEKPRLLFFKKFDNTFFPKQHPLNHPNLVIFEDRVEGVFITLQMTTSIFDMEQMFDFFSNKNLKGLDVKQFISTNPRFFLINEVLPLDFKTNFIDNEAEKLNIKMMKIMIQNNLRPDWLCTNFNSINWDKFK